MTTLSSCFEEFRFTRLIFKMHPVPTAFNSGYVIGYTKVDPVTAPTTSEGIYQSDVSRYISAGETVSQIMTVSPQVLKGGLRNWYKTSYTSATDDVDDSFQGVFFASNAGTSGGFTVEVGYTVQFRGNDDPSSS
jgi:hypothetical protein